MSLYKEQVFSLENGTIKGSVKETAHFYNQFFWFHFISFYVIRSVIIIILKLADQIMLFGQTEQNLYV